MRISTQHYTICMRETTQNGIWDWIYAQLLRLKSSVLGYRRLQCIPREAKVTRALLPVSFALQQGTKNKVFNWLLECKQGLETHWWPPIFYFSLLLIDFDKSLMRFFAVGCQMKSAFTAPFQHQTLLHMTHTLCVLSRWRHLFPSLPYHEWDQISKLECEEGEE